jgi:four helix bundle protein
MQSFRELIVWQKAITLTEDIYKLTAQLPVDERFGLTSQMRRAAISVASNIAEGAQRNNRAEFRNFCGMAYGSTAELETQLQIAERVYGLSNEAVDNLVNEIQRMLHGLIRKLTTKI